MESPPTRPVDAPPRSVSVMVPAFNEEGSLESVVREIHGVLAGLGRRSEIVIIDDGSTDRTVAIADRLAGELPTVRVIRHPENGGLGAVYRSGFAGAREELVTFFPADGQFPAAILERFVPLLDRHDMVLGYLPERRGSLFGRALSLGERALYGVLFGGFPRFQGILMFRRALLDGITLRSSGRGWAIVMELILRVSRSGARVHSEPTALRPRMSGASKVNNLRTIWANLKQLAELRRDLSMPRLEQAAERNGPAVASWR